ncbi:MAG: ABC transporter ATP-binding protein, partial [Proteobacteria bacterium]|nr:ABC transporter ATP-binding protein [Pseudomonadota bacterium]
NSNATTPEKPASGNKRRDARRANADERARLATLQQEAQRLEKRIAQVEADKRQTDTALADPALYDGGQSTQLQGLTRQASALSAELAKLEEQWLAAHEALERET